MVVNFDKREFLDPHKFGDGLKAMEFGCSAMGTMTALAFLLAGDCDGSGGDFQPGSFLLGWWSGDKIAIVGDYGDGTYAECREGKDWRDVSKETKEAMSVSDAYLASEMRGGCGDA